ncbi:MAG TPA: lipoate--protein ligase family protein [Ignavibacteria bacterium]
MELSENNICLHQDLGRQDWQFFDSGFRTGNHNMAFDLELVERCREDGTSFLRFYRWKPYALSLGYNQNKASNALYIDYKKCQAENIDVVTRPTGGRAVLHSEELTYSVVFKSQRQVHELYRDISLAILNGLKTLDPKLQKLSFTKDTPDILKLMKTGMYNLCFNSAIKNEINYKGKKLVGSAQRKFGNFVLQHGSILIGTHHKNIANYLNITAEHRLKMKKEIDDKTICLNEITGRSVGYEEVSNAVFSGFKETFNIEFKHINRVPDFVSERIESSFN